MEDSYENEDDLDELISDEEAEERASSRFDAYDQTQLQVRPC